MSESKRWTTADEITYLNGLGQYTCHSAADRKALLVSYVMQSLHRDRNWGEVERTKAILHAISLYEEKIN